MKFASLAVLATATSTTALSWAFAGQPKSDSAFLALLLHSTSVQCYALPKIMGMRDNIVTEKRHEDGDHSFVPERDRAESGRDRNGTNNANHSGDGRGRNRGNGTTPEQPPSPPQVPPANLPQPPAPPGSNSTIDDPKDANKAGNSTLPTPGPPSPPLRPGPPGSNSTNTEPNNIHSNGTSTTPPASNLPPHDPPRNGTAVDPVNAAKNSTAPPNRQPEVNGTGPGSLPANFPPPVPIDPGFVAGGFKDAAVKRAKFLASRRSVKLYSEQA